MEQTKVQPNYKDTTFRMLFREKENLLSLYNALNRTSYTNVDCLEITTLENAVYMNYKNDISFIFDYELMLYEHQSTVNPNMPLRDLFYVSSILQGQTKDNNLYGSALIRLPAPQFVIFYNGTDPQPERQVLRLSNAYEKQPDEPGLELVVTVYNINWGHNNELMDACRLLKEYARYVERVRILAREMPFQKAVEQAVDDCIREGILREFLSQNRAEVIAMSIFEYDEEKHLKSERELAYKHGWDEGLTEGETRGVKKGEKQLSQLLQSLNREGRIDDMHRALFDLAYREKLYKERGY